MTDKSQPPATAGPNTSGDTTYRLKGMVIVRLLAEATALVLLFVLPGILLAHGDFWKIALPTRIMICVMSVVSLLVLPFYASIAYKVRITVEGLTTISLLASQTAEWPTISGLRLQSNWGWRRYVVTADGGDLNFPIWLARLPDLVHSIRDRLPNRGVVAVIPGGPRLFRQEVVSRFMQAGEMLLCFLFVGVCWAFAVSLRSGTAHGPGSKGDAADFWIILAACIVFTAFILLRALFLALMPYLVELKEGGIYVCTLFFKKDLAWTDLKGLRQPWFFLPDGVLVRLRNGGILLIADKLDGFDELQEELYSRVPLLSATKSIE